MLDKFKAVLNFSAFRPEPDDPSFSWKNRFGGRETALLQIGRASVSYLAIGRKGEITEGKTRSGELKTVFDEFGSSIADDTTDGWCQVSLDSRYVISLETNLSRKKGSEEALKEDPRSVLHARYEKGKRYALTHNPESNSTLLLSCDEETLKRIDGLCGEHGLRVGRIFCGTYVLLRHALAVTNTKKGAGAPVSALYIACCRGSVCILSQDKDNWVELRSRTDVYAPGDLQPLLDFIAPFHGRTAPSTGLVVVCDDVVEGFTEKLPVIFPGRDINNLTKPHLLAQLVYQN